MYSATHAPGSEGPSTLAIRQGLWFTGGLLGMLLVLAFDYRRLDRYAYLVFGAVVIALILVPLVGRVAGGSRRWITIGPVSIQPSEFMKPALVIALAHYFARTAAVRLGFGEMIVRPDDDPAGDPGADPARPGSAAMLGFVFISMWSWAASACVARCARVLVIMVSPIVGPFAWGHLKTYQQQRILTSSTRARPAGRRVSHHQSKIAVGRA